MRQQNIRTAPEQALSVLPTGNGCIDPSGDSGGPCESDRDSNGCGQHRNNSGSWQEDYEKRMRPDRMTRLLRYAVPVLKSVGWSVKEVTHGGCRSELPLCFESTNQHGTHQAALISLSADYTGGVALASLFRGVPVAGVHPCTEEESVSLWLASMEVRYRSPSSDRLIATCRVPGEMVSMIQRRYQAGQRVLVNLPVTFTAPNGEIIAEAQMRYFAQPSAQLKQAKGRRRSSIGKHQLKASARMIAGLRAASADAVSPVDRDKERQAAGPHGKLLAERLTGILPQLQELVSGRTRHIDETLTVNADVQQVVLLGAGLDLRPFRLSSAMQWPTFFEIDLPEMLEERELVLAHLETCRGVRRHSLAADFMKDRVGRLLRQHPDFDPSARTVVVYEGCSMYFTAEDNRRVLQSISQVLEHPDSELWCDMVTSSVVNGTTSVPAITDFVSGMRQLGESFVFGCDEPARFMKQCGFSVSRVVSAQDYLASSDQSLSTYQFVVCQV